MSDIIIREAQPEDAAQLIVFLQRLFSEPHIDVLTSPEEFKLTVEEEQAIIKGYAASENSVFFVSEVDAHIIGILNCDGGKRKAIRHTATLGVSVRKEWRNKGVGSKLMAHTIEWAKSTKIIKRIELTVFARNVAAIHVYEKYGFVVEGRRQRSIYRDGEYLDDVMMALIL